MSEYRQDNGGNEAREYPGSSRDGFSAAAADAVARAEEQYGEIESELWVVEESVEVHGPIGDYRVVLSPTRPPR
jgi:flavin-binding protein dodecin